MTASPGRPSRQGDVQPALVVRCSFWITPRASSSRSSLPCLRFGSSPEQTRSGAQWRRARWLVQAR